MDKCNGFLLVAFLVLSGCQCKSNLHPDPENLSEVKVVWEDGYYGEGSGIEKSYVNGVLHGITKIYGVGGKLLGEEPYVNGLLHGRLVSYHEEKILSTCEYVQGRKEGLAINYNDDGSMCAKTIFLDSLPIKNFEYFDDGTLASEQHKIFRPDYVKGSRDDEDVHIPYSAYLITLKDISYHENGKVNRFALFDNVMGKMEIKRFNNEGIMIREEIYSSYKENSHGSGLSSNIEVIAVGYIKEYDSIGQLTRHTRINEDHKEEVVFEKIQSSSHNN